MRHLITKYNKYLLICICLVISGTLLSLGHRVTREISYAKVTNRETNTDYNSDRPRGIFYDMSTQGKDVLLDKTLNQTTNEEKLLHNTQGSKALRVRKKFMEQNVVTCLNEFSVKAKLYDTRKKHLEYDYIEVESNEQSVSERVVNLGRVFLKKPRIRIGVYVEYSAAYIKRAIYQPSRENNSRHVRVFPNDIYKLGIDTQFELYLFYCNDHDGFKMYDKSIVSTIDQYKDKAHELIDRSYSVKGSPSFNTTRQCPSILNVIKTFKEKYFEKPHGILSYDAVFINLITAIDNNAQEKELANAKVEELGDLSIYLAKHNHMNDLTFDLYYVNFLDQISQLLPIERGVMYSQASPFSLIPMFYSYNYLPQGPYIDTQKLHTYAYEENDLLKDLNRTASKYSVLVEEIDVNSSHKNYSHNFDQLMNEKLNRIESEIQNRNHVTNITRQTKNHLREFQLRLYIRDDEFPSDKTIYVAIAGYERIAVRYKTGFNISTYSKIIINNPTKTLPAIPLPYVQYNSEYLVHSTTPNVFQYSVYNNQTIKNNTVIPAGYKEIVINPYYVPNINTTLFIKLYVNISCNQPPALFEYSIDILWDSHSYPLSPIQHNLVNTEYTIEPGDCDYGACILNFSRILESRSRFNKLQYVVSFSSKENGYILGYQKIIPPEDSNKLAVVGNDQCQIYYYSPTAHDIISRKDLMTFRICNVGVRDCNENIFKVKFGTEALQTLSDMPLLEIKLSNGSNANNFIIKVMGFKTGKVDLYMYSDTTNQYIITDSRGRKLTGDRPCLRSAPCMLISKINTAKDYAILYRLTWKLLTSSPSQQCTQCYTYFFLKERTPSIYDAERTFIHYPVILGGSQPSPSEENIVMTYTMRDLSHNFNGSSVIEISAIGSGLDHRPDTLDFVFSQVPTHGVLKLVPGGQNIKSNVTYISRPILNNISNVRGSKLTIHYHQYLSFRKVSDEFKVHAYDSFKKCKLSTLLVQLKTTVSTPSILEHSVTLENNNRQYFWVPNYVCIPSSRIQVTSHGNQNIKLYLYYRQDEKDRFIELVPETPVQFSCPSDGPSKLKFIAGTNSKEYSYILGRPQKLYTKKKITIEEDRKSVVQYYINFYICHVPSPAKITDVLQSLSPDKYFGNIDLVVKDDIAADPNSLNTLVTVGVNDYMIFFRDSQFQEQVRYHREFEVNGTSLYYYKIHSPKTVEVLLNATVSVRNSFGLVSEKKTLIIMNDFSKIELI
ncbi:uncharacterized protein LOC126322606 [Schistocerca gregaria]|uniref:uncharacterized protein LOC126322606 n=1 Tax=Schistocerca gregaria TaxID=7010 RepID=UPI00211E450C|nr:uncharacterized protein LOC126322606 [Schistocerca gregaria]